MNTSQPSLGAQIAAAYADGPLGALADAIDAALAAVERQEDGLQALLDEERASAQRTFEHCDDLSHQIAELEAGLKEERRKRLTAEARCALAEAHRNEDLARVARLEAILAAKNLLIQDQISELENLRETIRD